jgi:hypothetical protein
MIQNKIVSCASFFVSNTKSVYLLVMITNIDSQPVIPSCQHST